MQIDFSVDNRCLVAQQQRYHRPADQRRPSGDSQFVGPA